MITVKKFSIIIGSVNLFSVLNSIVILLLLQIKLFSRSILQVSLQTQSVRKMADEKKMTDSLSEPASINFLINCFNRSLNIKSLGDSPM